MSRQVTPLLRNLHEAQGIPYMLVPHRGIRSVLPCWQKLPWSSTNSKVGRSLNLLHIVCSRNEATDHSLEYFVQSNLLVQSCQSQGLHAWIAGQPISRR